MTSDVGDGTESVNLLFVCHGTDSLAPMAAGWARRYAEQLPPFLRVTVHAAGIEVREPDPRAVAVMAANDVEISSPQATVLSEAVLDQADLVVTLCSRADEQIAQLSPGKRHQRLSMENPATVTGSEAEIARTFQQACRETRDAVGMLFHQLILTRLEENLGSVFQQTDVEVVSRERAYRGFIPVDVLDLRHRLFAGGWSETMRRELAIRPAAVGVLLYDPQRDDLVLVKQFRTGVLGADQSPWMLEIVAGLADADEAPIDVVRREAREEANCEIVDAIPICDYFNSPGWCDEKVSLFCARVDAGKLQGIHGLDDEHEDILIVTVPREKAVSMVASGEINNAMSIIAIQWLQLNRNRFGAD